MSVESDQFKMISKRKLFTFVLLIVILGASSESPIKFPLSCKFHGQHLYSCAVKGLENQEVNASFTEVKGKHAQSKTNDDVQGLMLRNQNISYVPNEIAKFFPNLIRYEVSNSPLRVVLKDNFKGLRKLETLIIAYTLVTSLNPDTFDELSNLQQLRLHNNALQTVHYESFSKNRNLEILLLNNNKITFIHEDLLKASVKLREIHLQDNVIEDLREKTFSTNSNLEVIDMRNNRLKTVGTKLLEDLTHLKNINFTNNPCITRDYKDVSEITEIFRSNCFPPHYERFENEIKSLTDSFNAMNKTMQDCNIALQTKIDSAKIIQSEFDELQNEKESVDTDLTDCGKSKEELEVELAHCKHEMKVGDELLKIAGKNLTECYGGEKMEAAEVRHLMTNIYKVLSSTADDRRINESERDESEPKTCDIEMTNLKRENQELREANDKLRLEKDNLESRITQSDAARRSELQSSLSTCKMELGTCLRQLPICNSFSINCMFYSRGLEYTCKAKHLSACKPGMKITRIDGAHTHSTIPRSPFDVNSLEITDSIFHFTNDIFENLPNLKRMKVINSGLSSLEPKLRSSVLLRLELDSNNIKEVPEESFTGVSKLQSLLLENDGIETLNRGSFAGLFDLHELSLRDNKISQLPNGVFNELIKLTHLSLKNNKIRSLDGDLLNSNSRLEIIKMDGNNDLNLISPKLFDSCKALTKAQFDGTCLQLSSASSIANIKQKIIEKCQNERNL